MNRMEEIAKMLGVELGEEFEIEGMEVVRCRFTVIKKILKRRKRNV